MEVGIVRERQKIVAVNVQFNCSCEILKKEKTNGEGSWGGRLRKQQLSKASKRKQQQLRRVGSDNDSFVCLRFVLFTFVNIPANVS